MAPSVGAEWWRPSAAVGSGRAGTTAAPPKDSAVPFAALLVFTFVLLLAPQTFVPGLARLRIALLAGAVATAAYCWDRFVQRRPLVRLSPEMWTAGALLTWAVATLPPLSEWPDGSVQMHLDHYLKAMIIFWLLSHTVTTLERLRTVAWALSLMAVPLALTGVWNFLSHHTMSLGRVVGYDAPLTLNPNDLALVLNLILPLTLALLLVSPRPVVRCLLAGLIVLDATAIIVTFSRGGFLTLATILVLCLRTLHRRRMWRWALAALLLAMVAVPFLPQGYLGRLGTIANINADETGSAQNRWGDARAALVFALRHPMGAGLGMNVPVIYELRGPDWRQPLAVHNVYLEYAVDLGWPGLGLFLLLLISCIRSAVRVRDRCAGLPALWELSALAETIRITLVAFAVGASFLPVAYNFYFYYFAALAVALPAAYAAEASHLLAPLAAPTPEMTSHGRLSDRAWRPARADQPL